MPGERDRRRFRSRRGRRIRGIREPKWPSGMGFLVQHRSQVLLVRARHLLWCIARVHCNASSLAVARWIREAGEELARMRIGRSAAAPRCNASAKPLVSPVSRARATHEAREPLLAGWPLDLQHSSGDWQEGIRILEGKMRSANVQARGSPPSVLLNLSTLWGAVINMACGFVAPLSLARGCVYTSCFSCFHSGSAASRSVNPPTSSDQLQQQRGPPWSLFSRRVFD